MIVVARKLKWTSRATPQGTVKYVAVSVGNKHTHTHTRNGKRHDERREKRWQHSDCKHAYKLDRVLGCFQLTSTSFLTCDTAVSGSRLKLLYDSPHNGRTSTGATWWEVLVGWVGLVRLLWGCGRRWATDVYCSGIWKILVINILVLLKCFKVDVGTPVGYI